MSGLVFTVRRPANCWQWRSYAATHVGCAHVHTCLSYPKICPAQTLCAWRQVRSVPGELSTDTNAVLRLAQATGHVAKPQLLQVGTGPFPLPRCVTVFIVGCV